MELSIDILSFLEFLQIYLTKTIFLRYDYVEMQKKAGVYE